MGVVEKLQAQLFTIRSELQDSDDNCSSFKKKHQESQSEISSLRQSVISLQGESTEKSELLAGGATSRVAHSKVEPSNADFDAYLNSLPDASISMGKPGETEKQKGLEVASKSVPKPRNPDD